MKKLTALLFAMTMVFTSTACGGKKNSKVTGTPAAVTVSQTSYATAEVFIDDNDVAYVNQISAYDDGLCLFYSSNDEKMNFARTDREYNIISSAVISGSNDMGMVFSVNNDGSFDIVTADTDFEFEYDENQQITNWEQYFTDAKFTLRLMSYDNNGNIISQCDIEEIGNYFSAEYSGLRQLVPCGEDRFMLNFGNGLALFDKDGNIIDHNEVDQLNTCDIAPASDGSIICVQNNTYGFMKPDSAAIPSDMTYAEELIGNYYAPVKGTGAFIVYFNLTGGLHGLTENGDIIKVMDYNRSLISSTSGTIIPYEDGVFISSTGKNKIMVYTRRPDDYVENRKDIDVWMTGSNGQIHDMARDFCALNDQYYINVKENVQFDDIPTAILAGDGPDVLYSGSGNDMPYLVNLGALEDMKPYFEGDTGLSKDMLVPNVLDALTYKGGIYMITDYFRVSSCITNKEIVGEEYRNWSMADMLDIYDNMPPGTMLTDQKYGVNFLLYSNAWIDYDNYTCNYDCDEFIRLLDICKEHEKNFPETDLNDLDGLKEYYCRLKNGEVVFSSNFDLNGISSLLGHLGISGMTMEDISLLYEPGCKGQVIFQDCYSIAANSDCKDGAWEFISYAINESYQFPWSILGFSTNNNNFLRDLNRYVDPPTGRSTATNVMNGFPITHETTTTQEQIDRIYDYVVSCKTMSYRSRDVDDIIQEEYGRFERDQITAEECARNLQERISIMLSEAA